MLQRLRAARQNQNGFTLIELLLVIVILGILAGIAVFAVSGINDRGVEAACEADKRTVMTAVEAFYAEKSAYPAADAGAPDPSVNRMDKLVTEKYLKARPANDNGYVITLDAAGVVTGSEC